MLKQLVKFSSDHNQLGIAENLKKKVSVWYNDNEFISSFKAKSRLLPQIYNTLCTKSCSVKQQLKSGKLFWSHVTLLIIETPEFFTPMT